MSDEVAREERDVLQVRKVKIYRGQYSDFWYWEIRREGRMETQRSAPLATLKVAHRALQRELKDMGEL